MLQLLFRLFLINLLFFLLISSCAGKKVVVKKSNYFITGRYDIHVRNVFNYSNTLNINFEALKYIKEYFETNSQLPLNNYIKTASLIADIEIMDYKIKPFRTNNTYKQFIFWAKFRISLLGPMATKIFIDRKTFTLGTKIEIAPHDASRINVVGNKALFDYLGENIINLVKFGKIKEKYNYDFEVL